VTVLLLLYRIINNNCSTILNLARLLNPGLGTGYGLTVFCTVTDRGYNTSYGVAPKDLANFLLAKKIGHRKGTESSAAPAMLGT